MNETTIAVQSSREVWPQWYSYVATNILLTWRPTRQLFTVLFFLVKFKTLCATVASGLAIIFCAKALSSKWRKLLSKYFIVKKLCGLEVDTRWFCVPVLHYFPIVSRTVSAKRKSFRHLLERAAAHCACERRRCGYGASSDFWREKMRDVDLCKFTFARAMALSALVKLAIVTGYILDSFQRGGCNGALAIWGWSW